MLNKKMYKCLIDIQAFNKNHNFKSVNQEVKDEFVKLHQPDYKRLLDSSYIKDNEHSIEVLGPAFLAMEAYNSKRNDRIMQLLFLIISIASLTTAIMSIVK